MATRYTVEFQRVAVRIATTNGLTRPQASSDLGIGLSTLNTWVRRHQQDDLISGPHEDVEKENTRLRKEVRLPRDERGCLERRMVGGISLQSYEGTIARLLCVAGPPDEPATTRRNGYFSAHPRATPPQTAKPCIARQLNACIQ